MQNKKENIFNMVLASTVHDMKNSLGMLGESINFILSQIDIDSLNEQTKDYYGVVQYESSRVNNSLMQLLALYKLENNQLPYNPNYVNLSDFLEEQKIKHLPLLEAKEIECIIDVDEAIEGFFDDCLIATVLENIIGNSIRYTRQQIKISCHQNSTTTIVVSDDGPGYPESMLQMEGSYMLGINQSTGSTGLGLFFAQKIAEIHHHKDKVGTINLSNGGELGGSQFEINIP